MPDQPRRGLGRGLSALMADLEPATSASRPAGQIAIELIHANPDQPRRTFDEDALNDLAESIRGRGVIQPIIVRPDPREEGTYSIVAGERRWRAAQRAQLHEMPAIVRDFSDEEVLEVAIVENVQRVDLNPLEEALGLQQLIDRFGHTQEQVGKALGKSRSHIANLLRLLGLPDEAREMLREGKISAGHARALLTATDPVGLARAVVAEGLSVRETEKRAKGPVVRKANSSRKASAADADTAMLQADLAAALGMPVTIQHKGDGSGEITVGYRDLDQLDSLCERLTGTGLER